MAEQELIFISHCGNTRRLQEFPAICHGQDFGRHEREGIDE
ncbi:MAG: hypothetical protein ACE5I1_10205 [bacterium]